MARSNRAKTALHVAYLDISKAYDTVNHEQLWNVCKEMGIGGQWLENMKAMYEGATVQALTEQGKTKAVNMARGIRQGCPMSPILFALYVEPITRALKEETEKKTGTLLKNHANN